MKHDLFEGRATWDDVSFDPGDPPTEEYDPHEDDNMDIFLENFYFTLSRMATIYKIHREDGLQRQRGDVAAAAPEMLDALKMVVGRSVLSRVQRNTVNSDTVTVKLNPDQWRIITDAIKKAEGGDSE